MASVLRDFISSKERQGSSPRTIENYRLSLAPFQTFMGDVTLKAVTTQTLSAYLDESAKRKPLRADWTGNTARRRRYDVLRTFLNYCVWMGYFELSPLKDKPPREPTRIIVPFTPEEVQKMVASCGRNAYRDKAIIMVLCDSGIRLNELSQMRRADIDWQEGSAHIHGKGAKQRRVPLSPTTLRYVDRYAKGDSLWLSEEGHPLTRSGCQQIIRRISKTALGRTYGPHKFRHTAACAYLMSGMSVSDLATMLGHASQRMALQYAEYVRERHAIQEAKRFSYVEKYLKGGT